MAVLDSIEDHRVAPPKGDRQLSAPRVMIGAVNIASMLWDAIGERACHHETAGEFHFGPLVPPING